MIFASMMTMRCALSCTMAMYSATWRSSAGIARTTTVPVCGLMITPRPSPVPTIASSVVFSSGQKSASLSVSTLDPDNVSRSCWP